MMNAPDVIVAMSGGVDSSIALQRIVEQGHVPLGVTMDLIEASDPEQAQELERDREDARETCRRFGVEHRVIDLRDEFRTYVSKPFCLSYLNALTPNPCVECNRSMKFGILHEVRKKIGAEYLATGHYARCAFNEDENAWQLLRALDPKKDQSYFLYMLDQDQLAHTLFPLGEMTKEETRLWAEGLHLPSAHKGESQDVCFIPKGDYPTYIQTAIGADALYEPFHDLNEARAPEQGSRYPQAFQPGDIVDKDGRVLGRHRGLIRYTIGQRKGIGVAASSPLYVIGKDPITNALIVGPSGDLMTDVCELMDASLISGAPSASFQDMQIKTHYNAQPVKGHVQLKRGGSMSISFEEPHIKTAPGQAVVIYDGDVVLGGGTAI